MSLHNRHADDEFKTFIGTLDESRGHIRKEKDVSCVSWS